LAKAIGKKGRKEGQKTRPIAKRSHSKKYNGLKRKNIAGAVQCHGRNGIGLSYHWLGGKEKKTPVREGRTANRRKAARKQKETTARVANKAGFVEKKTGAGVSSWGLGKRWRQGGLRGIATDGKLDLEKRLMTERGLRRPTGNWEKKREVRGKHVTNRFGQEVVFKSSCATTRRRCRSECGKIKGWEGKAGSPTQKGTWHF